MQSESNVTWYDLYRMHMYECLFVRYFGKYFSKVDSKVIFSWTNHNLQFYSNSYRFIIIKDMNVCCIIIWFITKKKNILSYQGEKEKERNKKERHILNQTILQTWFVAIFFFFHNTHKSFGTIWFVISLWSESFLPWCHWCFFLTQLGLRNCYKSVYKQ